MCPKYRTVMPFFREGGGGCFGLFWFLVLIVCLVGWLLFVSFGWFGDIRIPLRLACLKIYVSSFKTFCRLRPIHLVPFALYALTHLHSLWEFSPMLLVQPLDCTDVALEESVLGPLVTQ